jgi:3-hydroxybutyryl-CoA dehydrogenase
MDTASTPNTQEFTVPTDAAERPIVVVGAGTLGRRIAAVFASGGAEVRINDLNAKQREAALAYTQQTIPQLNQRLAEQGKPVAAGSVTATEDLAQALKNAWLVVEAVPERLDIKIPLFGRLDRMAPADALLATNSSSYASSAVIGEVASPQRVLNMHFAMPPASMAVELMSSGVSTLTLLEQIAQTLRGYGLDPYIARKESTGFIVASGVSTPEDVDGIMRANMGIADGPFQLMDNVGLDVVLDIEEHYAQEFPHLPTGPRALLHSYVDAGKLGRKSGEGFYKYE